MYRFGDFHVKSTFAGGLRIVRARLVRLLRTKYFYSFVLGSRNIIETRLVNFLFPGIKRYFCSFVSESKNRIEMHLVNLLFLGTNSGTKTRNKKKLLIVPKNNSRNKNQEPSSFFPFLFFLFSFFFLFLPSSPSWSLEPRRPSAKSPELASHRQGLLKPRPATTRARLSLT